MNRRLHMIFLCIIIFCHSGMSAAIMDVVCEKTKHVYVITCKKTRALCENIQKHKKIIAGCVVYCAFELIGYSHSWDTPLRRLLTPKKLLDDAYERIANFEEQKVYQELQELGKRYDDLERQLEAIKEQKKQRAMKHQEILEEGNEYLSRLGYTFHLKSKK